MGLKILIISTKWGKRRTCVSVIRRNVNGPKLIMRPIFTFRGKGKTITLKVETKRY